MALLDPVFLTGSIFPVACSAGQVRPVPMDERGFGHHRGRCKVLRPPAGCGGAIDLVIHACGCTPLAPQVQLSSGDRQTTQMMMLGKEALWQVGPESLWKWL